jgi:hypothetical protein
MLITPASTFIEVDTSVSLNLREWLPGDPDCHGVQVARRGPRPPPATTFLPGWKLHHVVCAAVHDHARRAIACLAQGKLDPGCTIPGWHKNVFIAKDYERGNANVPPALDWILGA